MNTTSETTVRELDHRLTDGIDVRMLWHPDTNRISIAVDDSRSGESFEFEVDGSKAQDAFQHPFAYSGDQPLHAALAA